MANYSDSFKASLAAKGYTSSFTDAWNQYLQDNTAIESTVTPDMLAAWLSGKGFTGSVPDMLQQYAESRGYASHVEQVIADAFLGCYQDVYHFDGVDDRAQLAYRAIDPEGNVTIKWKQLGIVPQLYTHIICSQQISGSVTLREFLLGITSVGQLVVQFGGVSLTTGAGNNEDGYYEFSLVGTALLLKRNGVVVTSTTFTRGAAREPSAVTAIGVLSAGGVSSFGNWISGKLYDVEINGTLWPMSEKGYAIQLPAPSGLGEELITTSVLENPVAKGSHWTYLGDGRWQYIGDGSANSLTFLHMDNVPEAGLLEYEVESYSGSLSGVRWSATLTDWVGDRIFLTVGKKRAYFTSKPADLSLLRNTAGTVISCVIKNISFKPLGTCNPMTLVNTTAERWSEIEVPCA